MAFQLSPKQKWAAKRATARLNIYDGSVRSGKTVGSLIDWPHYILTKAPKVGDLFMVGKTLGSLRRNIINPLKVYLGNSFQYSPGNHIAYFGGREIHCIGANDERAEEKIRGATAAGFYGDEVVLWPSNVFKQMMMRMDPPGAQGFCTTNPGPPKHYLKTDYIDRRRELDLNYFKFYLHDNPYLSQGYIENLKKEYSGLWYSRFIEGKWVLAEGVIYDFFKEGVHTCTKRSLPEAQFYDIAVDYGTSNPTVFTAFGNNPTTKPKAWAENEYYYDSRKKHKQKTDDEYADDFEEFVHPYKGKLNTIWVDPSAASFKLQLKKRGFHQVKDADNSVIDGIRFVGYMLRSGEFIVCDKCENYVQEFGGFVWDEKAQTRGEDKPVKDSDHCQDTGRYFLYSRYGTKRIDYNLFV